MPAACDDRRPGRRHPAQGDRRRDARREDLLVPVFRGGRRVYDPPPLEEIRRRAAAQLVARTRRSSGWRARSGISSGWSRACTSGGIAASAAAGGHSAVPDGKA